MAEGGEICGRREETEERVWVGGGEEKMSEERRW